MNKEKIKEEAKEVFEAIKFVIANTDHADYCLSWWLNTRNFNLKSKLSTPKINQRCKLLIKMGLIEKVDGKTSVSAGTCYKLTGKEW